MIRSVKVTSYLGDSILLELERPELTGFCITSITGIGAGDAEINITETATGDGGTYNSGRVPSRTINISLTAYGAELTGKYTSNNYNSQTAEQLRIQTYKYFPLKREVELVITNDSRSGIIRGIVETNEPDIFSEKESFNISIRCPNAYFEKSNYENMTVFYGVEALFEFPFENDSLTEPLLEMGLIQQLDSNNVFYEGDVPTGFIMTFIATGNVDNLEIHNLKTREKMLIDTDKIEAITGDGIKSGDVIMISTVRREKRIVLHRDAITYNILNSLVEGSNWLTLTKGDNLFAFDAEYGKSNLQFYITNKILYEGL